jgi:hypothetical protein
MADMEYKSGSLCVNKIDVSSNLNLSKDAMTDFQKALKDNGFNPGGTGDWSDKKSMYTSEPRLAHLNIISDVNMLALSKEGMAGAIEGVNYNVPVTVEYSDDKGNYFKKYALLSGQGRSSLSFLKKGLSFDFFNEDTSASYYNEDDTFKIKFGDWVYQDSFHIKSYYTDWPRCTTPVTYKLANEVLKTRGLLKDRPYKKYYVGDYSYSASGNSEDSLDKNMETGALCIPDGFPVIVYQNGEFWGVNSWQLKKHRDNYQLNKKKSNNIHLDGDFGISKYPPSWEIDKPFWLWDGSVNWKCYCSGSSGIETRNPKNLCCIDGTKYNVDNNDKELAGHNDGSPYDAWDSSKNDYAVGDIVSHNSRLYLNTVENNVNTPGIKYSIYIKSKDMSNVLHLLSDEIIDICVESDPDVETKLNSKGNLYIYASSKNNHKSIISYFEDNYNYPPKSSSNDNDDPDFKNYSGLGWVNCTTAVEVKNNIIDLTKYVPDIRRFATVSTSNGDIIIGSFGGSYSSSTTFNVGTYVKNDERYYMSIVSNNIGHQVTDTDYWYDITEIFAQVKIEIEKRFDINSFIDYVLIENLISDADCWDNNGQIVTWGKLKGSNLINYSVNVYDLDIAYGCVWNGTIAGAPNSSKYGISYPLYKEIWNYYYEELKLRYKQLRDAGIFNEDHVVGLFRDWMNRVGIDNYKKEYKKWPESPCFRDGTKTYEHNPTTGGFYGSIYRIYLWVKKRIEYMDSKNFFDYTN